ncbi:Response regulator receiver domain-containing protein [Dyadobacter koreensis]|uniref:Response regulator receiver domain-containing protein n=1 Tax=Dyadobacter koreensis TaxID=408657 RepID=A0A1H6QDS7_9BACT|nr:response regulator [Dyadobacter koreensis]SEI37395.1 Response regulator receiver domain-containing protein [Dyadobacter koreensis]
MNKLNTVCVIDDDLIYSIAIKHIINRSEISTDTQFFKNGQPALEYFKQNLTNIASLPDVILLDLNMPILDGWQFLDKYEPLVNQISKTIPVYIVSSSVDEEEYKKAKTFQTVKDFIVKPITVERLQQIAQEI